LLSIPRELVRPTGPYAGAVPSTTDLLVGSDRSLAAAVQVGANGAVVHIGLVRIAADKVPGDARDAVEPAPEPGRVSGVVWRDFKPGVSQPGVVEPGEIGLPGVTIRLQRDGDGRVASTTTGPDGTFRLSGAEPGNYHVAVSGATFRPPWEGINWLGPTLITPAAIIAAIWVWAGFSLVTIGAGLAAIDRELLEAARVDGATEWQVFRRITVPLLGPVLGVVFITMTINALKMFDLVFAIAPGSSQDKADVIALEMWRTAFTGAGNRGLGAAIAVFLFVLVLPVLAFNIRRFRVEESRR
jgi:alpha-glucoside transport system permease protein